MEGIVITPVLLGIPNSARVERAMIFIQKRTTSESISLMPLLSVAMYLKFALIDNVEVLRREIHDGLTLISRH
jgi:hypothetical protein